MDWSLNVFCVANIGQAYGTLSLLFWFVENVLSIPYQKQISMKWAKSSPPSFKLNKGVIIREWKGPKIAHKQKRDNESKTKATVVEEAILEHNPNSEIYSLGVIWLGRLHTNSWTFSYLGYSTNKEN